MLFEELDESERNMYYELSEKLLDGQIYCTRVWSAWSHHTMTEDDFNNSIDDTDLVLSNAKLIYEFLQSRFRKMKIEDFLNNELNEK